MEKTINSNLEQIRVAIQREYLKRCRRNSSYSLRAFAKYLEIDQSFLSKILKGKRPVTQDLAEIIGLKLGFKLKQTNNLFSTETSHTSEFLPLTDDEFEVISEWYHFAILELSKTSNFDSNPLKIAKRLGLHVEEVRDALQRLQRLGFIKLEGKRVILLTPKTVWNDKQKTSIARKKLQRNLLEKSIYALDYIPLELREHGSVTVAINQARISEFKEKLNSISFELANYFQNNEEKNLDEVYQLTISFFPITTIKNNK